MKKILHLAASGVFAFLVLLLLANISNGRISLNFKNKPDALTSATVEKKAETSSFSGISGNFIVFINKNTASDGTLDFFTGKTDKLPAGFGCSIAKDDEKANRLAKDLSLTNVRYGDALLMLSRAEYGDFDVMILSKKTADSLTAKSLYDKDFVDVVEMKGE